MIDQLTVNCSSLPEWDSPWEGGSSYWQEEDKSYVYGYIWCGLLLTMLINWDIIKYIAMVAST